MFKRFFYKLFLTSCLIYCFAPIVTFGADIDFNANVPDNGSPSVSIGSHINNASYTVTTVPAHIGGKANDNSAGLGLNVNSTTFTLQRLSDGAYWNGSSWVAGLYNLATSHPQTNLGTSVDWVSSATLPVFAVDNYILIATATDKSNNQQSTSAISFSVSSATSIASPVITYPSENEQVVHSKPTIRGSGVAGATINLVIIPTDKTYTATVNSAGQWVIALTEPLAQGKYKIEATQVLGDLTSSKAVRNFSITIPSPTIENPKEGAVVENGKPQIAGLGLSGAEIKLVVVETGDIYSTIVGANGKWSVNIGKTLLNGSYTVKVAQTLNGLTSQEVSQSFIVGIVAPIIEWPTNNETIYSTRPVVTGRGIPDAAIHLVVDQTGDEYTTTVDEAGNWSIYIKPHLAEGDYTIRATQTYNHLTSLATVVNFKLQFATIITGAIVNISWLDFTHNTIAGLLLVGTFILAILPAILWVPKGLPFIPQLANFFIIFLGLPGRKRGYGIVFDSVTRERLEGATVKLVPLGRSKTHQVKTGKRGSFYFDVAKSQKYKIEVSYKGYDFPSKYAEVGYKGEAFFANEGAVYRDIPLDNKSPESKKLLWNFQSFGFAVNILRVSLLFVGSLIATVFIIERGLFVDWLILGFYVLIWLIDAYNYKRAKKLS